MSMKFNKIQVKFPNNKKNQFKHNKHKQFKTEFKL